MLSIILVCALCLIYLASKAPIGKRDHIEPDDFPVIISIIVLFSTILALAIVRHDNLNELERCRSILVEHSLATGTPYTTYTNFTIIPKGEEEP